MTAEIVAVGTELLLGEIVDTNSTELGRALASHGVSCYRRQVVGDNVPRIVEALQLALARSDIVFTIGGLGPTMDDVTREGIALALDEDLILDEDLEREITAKLESRRVAALTSHARQALRPSCATPIANPNGTAPGLFCLKDQKAVVAMPGPRLEFAPMLHGPVGEWLRSLGQRPLLTRTIKVIEIGESAVEDRLRDLMQGSDPSLAPYAKTGEVHLRIASGDHEAIDRLAIEIVARLGDNVYGVNDDSLESVVLDDLRRRVETVAVAESCTGGGLGARLTSVPGSSDVFLGGVVSYSNALKISMLGVSQETVEKHGAVSEECAREMAEGVRDKTGADWGVSVTGIAGPDGGSDEKPIGLVFIGLAGPHGTTVSRNLFQGTRESVRDRSTQAALILLWQTLKASPKVQ